MPLYPVLLLAVVQGLTEFLPVSSSGHLALIGQMDGWRDQGLAFDAAIHLGTLLAIVWYARQDVLAMLESAARRQPGPERRLLLLVLAASLPVMIAGLLLGGWIESHLRSVGVIAAATLIFGALLALADVFGARRLVVERLRLAPAMWIGLAQVLALIPGTSRSGITMTAGLALGLERRQAARFSFLLAIPVLAAAGGYSIWRIIQAPEQQIYTPIMLLLAMSVAAIVALLTVRLFMRLVERIGMWPFAVYRVVMALMLFWLAVE